MKKYFDSLIIVTSQTDLSRIPKLVKTYNCQNTLILSSNKLFNHETAKILNNSDIEIEILYFGLFLNDAIMENIDFVAFNNSSRDGFSNYKYNNLLIYEKNKRIHEELKDRYEFKLILFDASLHEAYNLGVSYKYWKEQKGVPFNRLKTYFHPTNFLNIKKFSFLKKIFYLFTLFKPINAYEYRCNRTRHNFLFLSIERLRFNKNINLNQTHIKPFFFTRLYHKKNNYSLLEKNYSICVPLHKYGYFEKRFLYNKIPLLVFQDAFRPSNYSIPAYVNTIPYGKFVSRDMFDYSLYLSAKRDVVKPYKFLKNNFLNNRVSNKKQITKVILILNHAGDWSALINRSDTDILIENFLELAKIFDKLDFFIRLHPTMDYKCHEGGNSKKRIHELVQTSCLQNLSISSNTLEEDWNLGDLFISEYSLAAIDAIKQGKPIIFTNFTNRRSFMDDYKNLGFALVNNNNELIKYIQSYIDNPHKMITNLINPVSNYNMMYKRFIGD